MRPSAHAAATSLADNDDEVPIPLIPHRSPVVRVIVNMKFFFHALCFFVPPLLPVPWFPLALSRKLVTMADALLGVVHIDLLLLTLLYKILFPHKKRRLWFVSQ
jgi:hypothetical protein